MNKLEQYHQLFSLEGKVALIAGGAGDIGRSIGQALASYGAKVFLTGRSKEKADPVAKEICDLGGKAEGVVFKVDGAKAVEDLVEEVYGKHQRIDILVNALGTHIEAQAVDYKEEDWDHIMNVNVKTAFFLSKEVAKRQIPQGGGKQIHITSVRGLLGIERGYISYCTGRGGMNMMIKQLATEWGKHRININGIAPTFTRTSLVTQYLEDPAFYNPLVARIPLGRVAETRDIAGLALYLSAPVSDFVSGQIIYMDGGLTARQ